MLGRFFVLRGTHTGFDLMKVNSQQAARRPLQLPFKTDKYLKLCGGR
jgi:hypothetical protein